MARPGIVFPLKDAALREDVHVLGTLVGEVVADQCGNQTYAEVEGDRRAAIARRQGDPQGAVELLVRTRGRTPPVAKDLIRAFSTWFHVVNMAEKVHRIRRRREYLADSSSPQPGGLGDAFARLKARGHSLDEVLALLRRVSIEPVFTAHPTESTRRTVLRQQQRMARLLIGRLDAGMSVDEGQTSLERVRTELTTGWQTAENSRERLTIADEREHALFFVVEVIYEVIPAFYEEIELELGRLYPDERERIHVPELLHFGSWVGGDMDGHPDVHAKTIRESCARHQQLIVNRYFLEVQALAEKLSQSGSRIDALPAIQSRILQYASLVPGARATTPASHDRMPYRVLLGQVAERLRATYEGRSGQYEKAQQLIDDLELIADSLRQNRGQHAGLFYVRRTLRRVRTFGLHLVTLDVRQNADVHRSIVGRALGRANWAALPASERGQLLQDALLRDAAPTEALDAAAKRALWVFEAVTYCEHRYGEGAIGSYVVSQAGGADDLLAVLLIARWAGAVDPVSGQVLLDVAPLFESPESLGGAGGILAALLADPAYRAHLAARGNRQVVMVGYSDSNKATGLVSSRWLIREAQAEMAEVCARAGVELLIFHGRGGAEMRAGGRVQSLVRSVPVRAMQGRWRVTEQGESIKDRYGLRPIALRSFEQALNAVALAVSGAFGGDDVRPDWRELMDRVATEGARGYRQFVFDDPAFVDFFAAVTPIDVIERMQIGSRPVQRGEAGSGVAALRAAPWTFAWSQSRHMLPGWFGTGSAFAATADRGNGAELLGQMYGQWPFFAGLVDDVEVAIARADLAIAAHYEGLARPEHVRFGSEIRREYELTCEWVLRIKGSARLLDSEPTLQRSIRLRNPYVDPIHLMQVDLLQRWRESGREDRELFEALVASVNGIAQGLQGSG
jgi:phosphoenolpyruvate carboxylase